MKLCEFKKSAIGWTCSVCGRAVRMESEAPPHATCRHGQAMTHPTTRVAVPQPAPRTFAVPTASGPGTELKKLLAKIGIHATASCACTSRAALMDENERQSPGWCAAHIDTIVGWLREEAEKRGLPFIDAAGRVLVRRAIKNAKKLSDLIRYAAR